MATVMIECFTNYNAQKTYKVNGDELYMLNHSGIIPERIKEDIIDYSKEYGEEKYKFLVREID